MFAKNSNRQSDGIQTIQNDNHFLIVRAEKNGDELFATYNKLTKDLTFHTVEKPKNIFRIGFKNENDYKVRVNQLENSKPIRAFMTDVTNRKTIEISDDTVIAQAPLAIPIFEWLGGIILRYLFGLMQQLLLAAFHSLPSLILLPQLKITTIHII